MFAALAGLDRKDRDFIWMRGLGWGAASSLLVSVAAIVLAIVLVDTSALALILLLGLPALIIGTFGGGFVAWLGWKALLRGVRPISVLLVSILFIILLVPAALTAGISLMFFQHFDWRAVSQLTLWFSLGCLPTVVAGAFGVWHTLRALVRRNTWEGAAAA